MPAIADIKTSCPISEALAANKLSTTILTVGDAAVGVNRTYSRDGFIQPGVARWVDRSGGIAAGYPVITMSLRRPTKASAMYKAMMKILLPTLETTSASTASGITPPAQQAYAHGFVGEWLLPARGQSWERTALFDTTVSVCMAIIAASDNDPSTETGSILRTMIEDLDPPY